jgi:hypothetical protein
VRVQAAFGAGPGAASWPKRRREWVPVRRLKAILGRWHCWPVQGKKEGEIRVRPVAGQVCGFRPTTGASKAGLKPHWRRGSV